MPITTTGTRSLTLADINREAYIYFGAGVTVAWQMTNPGVGRGVAEHSTTLQRPLDRLRATMAYVYAVSLGSDGDRAAIARHVNRAHKPIRGDGYSAFDRDLQLWVAATLYKGALDVYQLFVGSVPATSRESLYRQAWTFGRTLQVDDSQWPATADAFEHWWQQQQARLSVDDQVCGYMQAVLGGGNTPWYLKPLMPLQRFATRGLMTPHLRELFRQPWTARDAANWERFKRWVPRLYWATPRWLRHYPARYYLKTLARRDETATPPRS